MATCTFILKRGKNAGKPCGKKCSQTSKEFCKAHESAILKLDGLPSLVHDMIIDSLIDSKYAEYVYPILWNLSQTSKYWYDFMKPKWSILYDSIKNSQEDRDMNLYNLTVLQKLSLLLECGCQACGKARITKIHWPFPMRLCTECLYSRTISDYRLRDEYAIGENQLRNLRYTSKDMWKRGSGYFTIKFYLISDIENMIGCPLSEYVNNKTRQLRFEIAEKFSMTPEELDAISPTFAKLTHHDEYKFMNIAEEVNGPYVIDQLSQWVAKSNIPTYKRMYPGLEELYKNAILTRNVEPFHHLKWDEIHINFKIHKLKHSVKDYRDIHIPENVSDEDTLTTLKKRVALQIQRRKYLGDAMEKVISQRLKFTQPINDDSSLEEWKDLVDEEIARLVKEARDARIKLVKEAQDENPDLNVDIKVDHNISISAWKNKVDTYIRNLKKPASSSTSTNWDTRKIYKCTICNDNRMFTQQGLMQHTEAKHINM